MRPLQRQRHQRVVEELQGITQPLLDHNYLLGPILRKSHQISNSASV